MNINKEISPAKSVLPERAHKGFYCTPFDNSKAGVFVMIRTWVSTGQRFGKLIIVKELDAIILSAKKRRYFLCKCDCGNYKKSVLSNLVNGSVGSCGCMTGEKHNMSNTRLYYIWSSMKQRCYYDKSIGAKYYKNKGIKVCNEWENSFIKFKEWALNNGYTEKLTIDRKDNDGNYCPSNCRWVTSRENCLNAFGKKVIYNGNEYYLTVLLDELKLRKHYGAIWGRLNRGWDVDKAIETPIKKLKQWM